MTTPAINDKSLRAQPRDPAAEVDAFMDGPAQPVPAETPEEMRQRALADSAKALRAKAAAGTPLSASEVRQLDRYAASQPLAGEPQSAKSASDRQCQTLDDVAACLGIGTRTLFGWRQEGVTLAGRPPYSLRACISEIMAAGKLGRCQPRGAEAQVVWDAVLRLGNPEPVPATADTAAPDYMAQLRAILLLPEQLESQTVRNRVGLALNQLRLCIDTSLDSIYRMAACAGVPPPQAKGRHARLLGVLRLYHELPTSPDDNEELAPRLAPPPAPAVPQDQGPPGPGRVADEG